MQDRIHTGWRRLSAATAVALLLLLCAALAACDSTPSPSADGRATGNGSRGHVKVGFPF